MIVIPDVVIMKFQNDLSNTYNIFTKILTSVFNTHFLQYLYLH